MSEKIQVFLVVFGALVAGVLSSTTFEKPKPHCREESLSTLEAWRMVAIPNYGPPPRNVVQVGESLWACGEHESRMRCYELEACR